MNNSATISHIRKVVLITNIPTPYRIPLFNELNKQLEERSIQFIVLFGALGYQRRKWLIDMGQCNFRYRVLRSSSLKLNGNQKKIFTYGRLWKTLKEEMPSIIICSGFSIATLKILLFSKLWNIDFIIWSEAILRSKRENTIIRQWYRRMLIKRATGFIVPGTKAQEQLVFLDAPLSKIFRAPNAVDNDFYYLETKKIKSEILEKLKKQILIVSYLTPQKNIMLVLKAIILLQRKRNDFQLNIVGDGNERHNLEDFVCQNKIGDIVIFHGYQQQEEIPRFFASCDLLLFPTECDVWGLILNEAMAAGILCLASIHAGARWDLIQDSVTGFSIDFADSDQVVTKIEWVLDHPLDSKQIAEKGRRYVNEKFNFQQSASGFIRAIGLKRN